MTGQFYEPQARDLIACDDGVHYVLLDQASEFCNWLMKRHPNGPLVSVRKATPHELAHTKARQHLRAGVAMLQGDAPEQRTPAPACHPDDQDEIYRIHRAFIAVDEANNEQVMAFQDASYVLGLRRGQGELAWEYSRAEDWCRAANKYSDSMCALGELLGVPEDDQSTGAVLDAVRGLKAREAALQQRLNEAAQRLDDSAQRLSASEDLLVECQADLERWQEAYGVAGDATWALLQRLQEHLAPQAPQHGSLRKS